MSQIRAKFRCESVTEALGSRQNAEGEWVKAPVYTAKFSAVYSQDPASENKQFWDATPSGAIELTAVKILPWKIGQEYYIDFTPAG